MGHNHSHHHNHGSAEKNIAIVFFLNFLFVIIEIVGGIATNSIAIISDAVHDIGDCLSLGVSWIFQKKSSKGRDEKYSYGYKRFSLLGSIFLSGVLCVSSIFVIIEAVSRLWTHEAVNANGMIWLAVLGIIINGAAAFKVKEGHSMNERSVYIHIMEDVLGWVAVLIASIVILFWDIPIIDPIMSIAISVWVLFNVVRNTIEVFRILMQAVPDGIDTTELTSRILDIESVDSIHDMHLWSMDGESHIMTLHIVCKPSCDKQHIRNTINKISNEYGIIHSTIEFEDEDFICNMNCDKTLQER